MGYDAGHGETLAGTPCSLLLYVAWAFATACALDMPLFVALAKAAEQRVHEFKPQGLANTVWALATATHTDAPLLAASTRAAERRGCKFTPQELANTAWAL